MNNFALCPLQRGYTPKIANNLLEQELMGGFARQRIQFVNNVHTVIPSVLLDDHRKQQYFWAFWDNHTENNPRPFLWRLIIKGKPQVYSCQFIADSLDINERNGKVYSVSFGLRLKPNNTSKDFDQNIIDIWESDDAELLLNLLEKLTNEDLPKTALDTTNLEKDRVTAVIEGASSGETDLYFYLTEKLTNEDLPKTAGGFNGND